MYITGPIKKCSHASNRIRSERNILAIPAIRYLTVSEKMRKPPAPNSH